MCSKVWMHLGESLAYSDVSINAKSRIVENLPRTTRNKNEQSETRPRSKKNTMAHSTPNDPRLGSKRTITNLPTNIQQPSENGTTIHLPWILRT